MAASPSATTMEIPSFGLDEILKSNAENDASLFERIDAAYGPGGPGVLCVRGDDSFQARVREIREQFLPQAMALTELPEEARARLVDPETPLTNGLSRGAEVTDRAKSSFYFHPVTDTPGDHLPEEVERVPVFHNPNLFPSEEELPGFKANARAAGAFVVEVGHEVAKLIDRRLDQVTGYAKGSAAAATQLTPGSNHKCRLIRYHPYETEEEVKETLGMWAAPHLDTGALTGLVPGIFVDGEGRPAANPDPNSGLYVQDRTGEPIKATVPSGCGEALLYQIGESLQIVSGGQLQATPHFVKGPARPNPGGVNRCTLAVFMQPQVHEELPIPEGMTYGDVAGRCADRHLPSAWPSLAWRFERLQADGQLGEGQPLTFGKHGAVTFANLGNAGGD